MTLILIAAVVFLAAFLQTLSGFGFALMVMPLITIAIGLRTAAPLVALTGLTLYAVNLARYWQAVNACGRCCTWARLPHWEYPSASGRSSTWTNTSSKRCWGWF